MRYVFLVIAFLLLQISACRKSSDPCTEVTITNSAPGCGGWGINVNGVKYPSSNIPVQYQQDGLPVCVSYDLYDDMRACACCGGTWATIKSIFYRH